MEREVTRVGKGGRVVIPVAFRRALGLDEGSAVVVVLEPDGVRVMSTAHALERAQRIVRAHVPAERDLVQDLLNERREEAQRE